MVATISAFASRDGATSRRTVAEGLAGLDAIAAGRAYDSYLVRAVVSSIYAESEPGEDPSPDRARLLADCRRIAQVLRDSADPGDAAAYRHWVQQVVVRVCRAAHSDGVQRWSGPYQLGPAERDFLDELAAALG